MKYYHMYKKLLSFDKKFTEELKEDISLIYNCDKWGLVMEYFIRKNMNYKNKNQITYNSFQLAEKIKQELDLEVFPIVERIYLGSMSNSEGYATWKMYESNFNVIGSNQPTREFLLKKNGIVLLNESAGSSFIFTRINNL